MSASAAQASPALLRFPGVVGSDLFRAKAIIREKLGPWTRVRFRLLPYSAGRRMPVVDPPQADQEVLLWMDTKWKCVALTPSFKGVLGREPRADAEWGAGDEDTNWSDDDYGEEDE